MVNHQKLDSNTAGFSHRFQREHGLADIFNVYIYLFFVLFWPLPAACSIFVSWPGIEPGPPAGEAFSLDCWTPREVPGLLTYWFQAAILQNWHRVLLFQTSNLWYFVMAALSNEYRKQAKNAFCRSSPIIGS